MGNALEIITRIASDNVSPWKEEAIERKTNREWSKRSFQIAVRILREIRAQKHVNGMTQKRLAQAMGVSPQYINKVVKGKENLTLETIAKIEAVLGITLLEVPSYDISNRILLKQPEFIFPINRAASIPISEGMCIYNKRTFFEATGTNG